MSKVSENAASDGPPSVDRALERGRRAAPNELAAFRALWREWAEVVALFAHRSRARRRVGEKDYAELHDRVVRTCKSLGRAADPTLARYFRNLQELAQPWPTRDVLDRGKGVPLDLLLTRCREVDRELAGRPASANRGFVAAAILAVVALAALSAMRVTNTALPTLKAIDDRIRWFSHVATHLTPLQSLFAFTVAITAVGVVLVRRAKY